MFQLLRDLKIKTRIQVGVGAFFLVVLLVSGTSLYYLTVIRGDAEAIFTRNYNILEKAQRYDKLADRFRYDWMFFADDRASNKAAIDQLYSGIYRFDSLTIDYKFLVESPAENELLFGLKASQDSLKLAFTNIRFVDNFDKEQVSVQVLRALDSMQVINEKLQNLERDHIFNQYEKTKSSVNRVMTYMIAIAGGFSLVALLLLWLVPQYIIGPLNELTSSFRKVAAKDFSQRIKRKSKDEFGELAEAFNKMTVQLDEYERMNISGLLKEKSRIEAIIQNLNESILITDEENKVIWVNQLAEKLFGLSKDQMLDQSLNEIVPVNFKKEALTNTEGAPAGRTLFNFSAVIDGEKRYYHRHIAKVAEGDKKESSAGAVLIFYDITDFKELDLAKTNFMATLSHQFKTPISAMNISMQLLDNPKTGDLNSEQKNLLGTIQSQGERLLKMVNELLDFSQIESGKIRIRKEAVEPEELMNYSLQSVQAILKSRSLRVKRSIEPNLPEVEVDLEKLTWVINNLLTNAARYSPEEDAIEVGVKRHGKKVRFEVSDHGPGISKEMQGKIFEKYQRHKFDQTIGTGLGLAIAREIIETHKGKIGVESELGEGSTFWFELPAVVD